MRKNCFGIIILFFLTAVLVPEAFSENTNACHCFTNRVYDPADRFAADDYILATSFNSLISRVYDIPKKQIVFLKMNGGANHMDMIIALRVAKVAQADLQLLLHLRKQQQSWQQILFSPSLSAKVHSDKLLSLLQEGTSIETVGPQIANSIIADFYNVPLDNVELLRSLGLNEKEMALIFILAHVKGSKPAELAVQHNVDGKSWSEIANNLGVEPAQAGKLIANKQ